MEHRWSSQNATLDVLAGLKSTLDWTISLTQIRPSRIQKLVTYFLVYISTNSLSEYILQSALIVMSHPDLTSTSTTTKILQTVNTYLKLAHLVQVRRPYKCSPKGSMVWSNLLSSKVGSRLESTISNWYAESPIG